MCKEKIQNQAYEKELNNKFKRLHDIINSDSVVNEATTNEFYRIKSQLEDMEIERARGIILRSKAQWVEEGEILREKLAICDHFLPRDVAFSRCARRRLAERVIRTDNQRWPRWWRGNVPRWTVQNGDGHISVLSGALRDVWQIHCGICKTGLLL